MLPLRALASFDAPSCLPMLQPSRLPNTAPFGVKQVISHLIDTRLINEGGYSAVGGRGVSPMEGTPHFRYRRVVFPLSACASFSVSPASCIMRGFPARLQSLLLGSTRQETEESDTIC